MASELERQDLEKSTAKKRGIFTLSKWCKINGHDGVTDGCIRSAMQSHDPQIAKMAKRAKLQGIVKGER